LLVVLSEKLFEALGSIVFAFLVVVFFVGTKKRVVQVKRAGLLVEQELLPVDDGLGEATGLQKLTGSC